MHLQERCKPACCLWALAVPVTAHKPTPRPAASRMCVGRCFCFTDLTLGPLWRPRPLRPGGDPPTPRGEQGTGHLITHHRGVCLLGAQPWLSHRTCGEQPPSCSCPRSPALQSPHFPWRTQGGSRSCSCICVTSGSHHKPGPSSQTLPRPKGLCPGSHRNVTSFDCDGAKPCGVLCGPLWGSVSEGPLLCFQGPSS